MNRVIDNTACPLYHTQECDLLNMPACEKCMINGKDEDDVKQIKADLDTLCALLPEGGVSSLFSGDGCRLCKKDPPEKKAFYGLLDLGHAEPKRTKRSIIGIKIKAAVGSLIPIQIGVCAACRKRILMLEYLPVLLPLAAGVLTLAALLLPGVSDSLERVGMLIPLAVFAGAVLIAALAGRLIAGALEKRYAKQMTLDPFELPTLREMRAKGWFPINTNGKRLRLVFARKRMQMGVGTGTPEDAVCPTE